jgi:hypothetical protein
MLTFSSISASVGSRVKERVESGRIGMSGLVAVSEAVIVNIMPWRDDNGCQAGR